MQHANNSDQIQQPSVTNDKQRETIKNKELRKATYVSEKSFSFDSNNHDFDVDPRYPWRKRSLRRSRSHEGTATGLLSPPLSDDIFDVMSNSFSGAFPSLEEAGHEGNGVLNSPLNHVASWNSVSNPSSHVNNISNTNRVIALFPTLSNAQISENQSYLTELSQNDINSFNRELATPKATMNTFTEQRPLAKGGLRRCRSSNVLAECGERRRVRFADEPLVISLDDSEMWTRPRSSRRTLLGIERINLPLSSKNKLNGQHSSEEVSINSAVAASAVENYEGKTNGNFINGWEDDSVSSEDSSPSLSRRRCSDTVIPLFEFSGRTTEGSWRLVVQPATSPVHSSDASNGINGTGKITNNLMDVFRLDVNTLLSEQQYAMQKKNSSTGLNSTGNIKSDDQASQASRIINIDVTPKDYIETSSSDYETLTPNEPHVYNLRKAEQTRRRKISAQDSATNSDLSEPENNQSAKNAQLPRHGNDYIDISNAKLNGSSCKLSPVSQLSNDQPMTSQISNQITNSQSTHFYQDENVGSLKTAQSNEQNQSVTASSILRELNCNDLLSNNSFRMAAATADAATTLTSPTDSIHQPTETSHHVTHLPRNIDYMIEQAHESNRIFTRQDIPFVQPFNNSKAIFNESVGGKNAQMNLRTFKTDNTPSVNDHSTKPEPIRLISVSSTRERKNSSSNSNNTASNKQNVTTLLHQPREMWNPSTSVENKTTNPQKQPHVVPFAVGSPPLKQLSKNIFPPTPINFNSSNTQSPWQRSVPPDVTSDLRAVPLVSAPNVQIPIQHIVYNNLNAIANYNVNSMATNNAIRQSSQLVVDSIDDKYNLHKSMQTGTSSYDKNSTTSSSDYSTDYWTSLSSSQYRSPTSSSVDNDSVSDYSPLFFNQPVNTSPNNVQISSVHSKLTSPEQKVSPGSVAHRSSTYYESPLYGMQQHFPSNPDVSARESPNITQTHRTFSPQTVSSPRVISPQYNDISPKIVSPQLMAGRGPATTDTDEELVQSRSFRMLQTKFSPGSK